MKYSYNKYIIFRGIDALQYCGVFSMGMALLKNSYLHGMKAKVHFSISHGRFSAGISSRRWHCGIRVPKATL